VAAANPKARRRPPRTGTGGAIRGFDLRRLLSFLPFLLLLLAVSGPFAPDPLFAQPAELAVDRENLRREPAPDGRRLAAVNGGTRLEIVGSRGRWREVVLSGWIWTPSVSVTRRSGFDLVVSADGGENLRAEPSGEARIAARLLEGFLLEELERRGNWTRVRRTAWMWAPSRRVLDGGAGGAEAPGGGGGDGSPAEGTDPGGDGGAGGVERAGLDDRLVVEGGSARLLRSPRSDTLAVLRPGTDLAVLERQGEWTRVRMEGWVRSDDVASPDSLRPEPDLTPADLRANPDRYRGRRVRWTVQFVSLERAEPVRTDFYEGEPFILARPGPNAGGFVYLAVPSELLPRVEELRPLERIRVTGRVRTGRSALMGAPVLDLLEFERAADRDG